MKTGMARALVTGLSAALLLQGCAIENSPSLSLIYSPSAVTSAEMIQAFQRHCVQNFPDFIAMRNSLIQAGFVSLLDPAPIEGDYDQMFNEGTGIEVNLGINLFPATTTLEIIEPVPQVLRNRHRVGSLGTGSVYCELRARPSDPESFETLARPFVENMSSFQQDTRRPQSIAGLAVINEHRVDIWAEPSREGPPRLECNGRIDRCIDHRAELYLEDDYG
jgi:hypothetical protein